MQPIERYTFADVEEAPPLTVFHDETIQRADGRGSYRLLILKGYSSCCAYLAVEPAHPLVQEFPHYDAMPLNVHGGLTFAGRLRETDPSAFAWGWDYAHLGDKMAMPREVRQLLAKVKNPVAMSDGEISAWPASPWEVQKEWTPAAVAEDARQALVEFEHLLVWAERRVAFRRIAQSSKTRLHWSRRPAMLAILRAEPTPEQREVARRTRRRRKGLQGMLRELAAWRRKREAKERKREVRELRRMRTL